MGTQAGRYVGQQLNNTNPLRRDTVLIPAYSFLVLRFAVDNRECLMTSFVLD
jgi:iron transport multicopper oxidase